MRERGVVHPREVDAHFAHGKRDELVRRLEQRQRPSCWTACTTAGCCASRAAKAACASTPRASTAAPARLDAAAAMDTLVDVIVEQVRAAAGGDRCRNWWCSCDTRCRSGTTSAQARWRARRRGCRTRRSTASTGTGRRREPGVDAATRLNDAVRLFAPFDPVVWDRRRFEMFWGWPYRFEAYTPAPKRVRGYYALPLLWRDEVIGWGNVAVDAADGCRRAWAMSSAARRATRSTGASSTLSSSA